MVSAVPARRDRRPVLWRSASSAAALVTTLLRQACSHFALALAQAWRSYRAAPAQVWQSLHRSYAYAQLLGLDTKPVEDALLKRSSSCRQIYLQCLLMALANPYAFAQAEQEEIGRASGRESVCPYG